MKDYIEVYTDDGRKEIMEAVCTFKLKNYKSNYIIYTELDKSHYYLAKYDKVNLTDLNTDFEGWDSIYDLLDKNYSIRYVDMHNCKIDDNRLSFLIIALYGPTGSKTIRLVGS